MIQKPPFLRPVVLASCLPALASLLGAACDRAPDAAPHVGETASVASPIINGDLDTTHQAVVAVLGNDFSCSGTIIQVANGQGYVLTAAHCCNPGDPPVAVVIGNDYNTGQGFDVVPSSVTRDGCYTDCAGSTDDVCMLRFSGADGSTPVIPAMPPASDSLATGTELTYVGYGITQSPPGGFNHKRRYVTKPIGSIDAYFIEYANPGASGTCEGDSGGPGLAVVGGVELVAGVTSFGDQDCVALGASIRTSQIYTNFIAPYLADQAPIGGTCPLETNCNVCLTDSTNPQCGGGCSNELSACQNDGACGALLGCYNACTTGACQTQCTTDHVDGLQKYEKVIGCICTDACSNACGSNSLCTGAQCGSVTATLSDACESCVENDCCAEAWTCSNDADCKKCFGDNPPAGCAGKADVQAYYQCVTSGCAGTCTIDPPGTSSSSGASTSSVGEGGAGGGSPSHSTTDAGAGGSAEPGTDSGCSCTVGEDARSPWWGWVGLSLAGAAWARRPTRRRSSSSV